MMKLDSNPSQPQRKIRFLSFLLKSLFWNQGISKIVQYFILIYSNAQCISILLCVQLYFITADADDSFSVTLKEAAHITSIKNLFGFPLTNHLEYLVPIVCILCYFLVFAGFFIVVAVKHRKQKNLSKRISRMIIFVCQFHLTFCFWFINMLLMDYLSAELSKTAFSEFTSEQVLLSAISLICIVLNYLSGFLFAIFSYDPFISSNLLASHSSAFQLHTFLFKAGIAPFFTLSKDPTFRAWTIASYSVFILLLRHYRLLTSFPYYHYSAMRTSVILSSTSVFISLVSFLTLAITDTSTTSPQYITYAEIIAIILSIKFLICYLQNIILKYLALPNRELKSKVDIMKKLFSLSFMMQRTNLTVNNKADKKFGELRLWGTLALYQQDKSKTQNDDNAAMEQFCLEGIDATSTLSNVCNYYTHMGEKVTSDLLQFALEKFKQDYQFKILFAHFALKNNLPFLVASLYLAELSKFQGLTKLIAFNLAYNLQSNIDKFFYETEGNTLNLKNFLETEDVSETMAKAVRSSVKNYTAFWSKYFKSNLKIKEFYEKSKEIELEADKIHSLWIEYANKNKIFAHSVCSMYSVYLSLIRGVPGQANKILRRYFLNNLEQIYGPDYSNPLSEETLTSPNVISLYASMAKDDPGKVIKTSSNFTEILGWTQNDIIGNSINIILPLFMQQSHQKVLQGHIKGAFEGKKSYRLYQIINGFVLHKSGHVLYCEVYLSIHPYVQETPMYMVILKVKKSQGDQLLVSKMGIIEGYTHQVGSLLGLNSERKTHLKNICQDYSELEDIINDGNSKNQSLYFKSMSETTFRKSLTKKTFKRATDQKMSLASKKSTAKSFTLNFFISEEHQKKSAKEKQAYTVNLIPGYFGDLFYFVMNLDHVFLDDELNNVQNILIEQGEQQNASILSDVSEKKPEERDVNILPKFLTSFDSQKINFPPIHKFTTSSFPLQETESGFFPPEVGNTKPMDTDIDSGEFFEKGKKHSLNFGVKRDSLALAKKAITLVPKSSLNKKPQESNYAKLHHFQTNTQNKEVNSKGFSKTRLDSLFSPAGSVKPLVPVHNSGSETYKMKEKKEPSLKQKHEIDVRVTSSVGTPAKAGSSKLEQAIIKINKSPKINTLHLTLVLFIALSAAPLLFFEFQTQSTLELVKSGIEVMSKSIFRTSKIIDVTLYARNLWLTQIGIFQSERYAIIGSTKNLTRFFSEQIVNSLNDLNEKNNELRSFVYKLDNTLQTEIYQDRLPIYETINNGSIISSRAANIFDLVTEVASNGMYLVTSNLPIDKNNPYLLFVLTNTLNQLLVASERVFPLLLKDNETKLDDQIFYVYLIMIVLGVCGALVLVFFIHIERGFIKDRNHFIHIFLMLNETNIQAQLAQVQDFSNTLERNNAENKQFIHKILPENYHTYFSPKTKGAKGFKKTADTRGINRSLIALFFGVVMFLIVLFSSYPALLWYITTGSNFIQDKMVLLAKSNVNLYNNNFLLASLYDYIQENITTYVKNKPIKEEWEKTYVQMTKVSEFLLIEIMDPEKGINEDPKLNEIITGNLCETIPIFSSNLTNLCKSLGGGAAEKGLIRLNSYTLASLKEVKDFFDNSERTQQDMALALSMQGLINIEIFYSLTNQAYIWIDGLIRSKISEHFSGFKNTVSAIVVSYLAIYAVIGGLLCRKIVNALKEEMINWRKMIRQIPYSVIIEDKLIRSYLARITNGGLNNLNNH